MGKDKVVEEIIKTASNSAPGTNDMVLKYLPLVIGLIALIVCYLLYKKFQTLNNTGDSLVKLEKQFTGFIKEQSEINMVNSKKFNSILSQMNQLSYILQNSSVREQNDINSQMSPEREQVNKLQQPQIKQPTQREFIPNNIQTNFPIKQEQLPDEMLKPVITTNKKETLNEQIQQIPQQLSEENKTLKHKNTNSKKVVTLTEDVLIEEASSDDDE
jgi:hypothetical protein